MRDRFRMDRLLTAEVLQTARDAYKDNGGPTEILEAAVPVLLDHMATLLPDGDPGAVLSHIHLAERERAEARARVLEAEVQYLRHAEEVRRRMGRLEEIANGKGGRASDVRAQVRAFINEVLDA